MPQACCWRIHGRAPPRLIAACTYKQQPGTHLHITVGDHSRIANVEAHDNERAVTAAE